MGADNDSGLYVETDGPATAETTVIFVHGLGDDLLTWDLQRDHLVGVPVRQVYYDHAGFGRSEPRRQKAVQIRHLADDLALLVDGQPPGPVILVGHSMGTLTVLALATTRPELFGDRVPAVILAASPGAGRHIQVLFPLWAQPLAGRVILSALRGLVAVRANTVVGRGFFVLLARLAFGRSTQEQRTLLAHKAASNSARTLVEHLSACLEFEEPAAYDVLGQIRTAVLVGSKDHLTPAIGGRRLARLIRGAELTELVGIGHMMHIEAPDSFNAVLDDMLASVTKDASGGHAA